MNDFDLVSDSMLALALDDLGLMGIVKHALFCAKNAAELVLFEGCAGNSLIAAKQYMLAIEALAELDVEPWIYYPRPYGGNS